MNHVSADKLTLENHEAKNGAKDLDIEVRKVQSSARRNRVAPLVVLVSNRSKRSSESFFGVNEFTEPTFCFNSECVNIKLNFNTTIERG